MDYKQWLIKNKLYIVIGLISILIIVSFFLFFLKLSPSDPKNENSLLVTESSERLDEFDKVSEQVLYADVKGAVKKPGLYEITDEMRVWNVIELAGGIQEEANTKKVNFAQKVSDQMVIYIPFVGEVFEEGEEEGSESEEISINSDKVNINKADLNELQTLTGIGQKKAQEIILYREENGSFQEIEELKKISGIGDKTFEKLKDSICLK